MIFLTLAKVGELIQLRLIQLFPAIGRSTGQQQGREDPASSIPICLLDKCMHRLPVHDAEDLCIAVLLCARAEFHDTLLPTQRNGGRRDAKKHLSQEAALVHRQPLAQVGCEDGHVRRQIQEIVAALIMMVKILVAPGENDLENLLEVPSVLEALFLCKQKVKTNSKQGKMSSRLSRKKHLP